MSDDGLVIPRRRFLAATAGGLAVAAGGLLVASQRPARASTLQPNWGWCSRCSEAYFGSSPFQGRGTCPAQPYDGHVKSSWNYSMIYNQGTTSGLPGTPGYQSGWYYCKLCAAIVWHATNPADACPASNGGQGSHNLSDSYNYAMPVNISGGGYQGNWCYCGQCGCYYHASSPGASAGFCWKVYQESQGQNQQHVAGGSWPYDLIVNST